MGQNIEVSTHERSQSSQGTLLDAYWSVIIIQWQALEDTIRKEGQLGGTDSHMENFHELTNWRLNIRKSTIPTKHLDHIF